MMTLKKYLLVLLITLVPLFTVYGQENQGKTFLWEIQSDYGKSYLLGSVHLLKEDNYPLKQVIEDSFDKSDVLVLEIDLSGDNLLKASMTMLQKGMYQDDQTLQDNISEKTYQTLKEKLTAMNMDIDGFKKNKPWFVAMMVLQSKLAKIGFNPAYGVDMHFLGKAKDKKEIKGLETIEFQVGLFEGFSKEEAEKFLLSSILEADQIEKEMNKMVDAWVNGNTEEMEKATTENIDKYPELAAFYKKLNDDRNVRMVENIISFLKTGKSHFIVVGALHLVGKKGIVQLLKDQGYTVNQL